MSISKQKIKKISPDLSGRELSTERNPDMKKKYKITILTLFKQAELNNVFETMPIVEEIYSGSFIEAVGDGMRLVGVLDQQWKEFTHELVSVRQAKN